MESDKPILLVDDISQESVFSAQRSLILRQFSLSLASHLNTWIQAVHVDDPSEFSIREPSFKKYLKTIFSMTKESFYQISESQKIRIRFTVREGDTAEEILKISDSVHAKFIVTGTYARAGLRRFFLGNITEEILNKVHIPTFIFGPTALRQKQNLVNHKQNRILLVTTLDEFQRAETVARSLALHFKSEVLIIEMKPEKSFLAKFLFSDKEDTDGRDRRRLKLHQLQLSFEHSQIEAFVGEIGSKGSFKKRLLNFAQDNQADLIVLSRSNRFFLQSLILRAESPVLAV